MNAKELEEEQAFRMLTYPTDLLARVGGRRRRDYVLLQPFGHALSCLSKDVRKSSVRGALSNCEVGRKARKDRAVGRSDTAYEEI